MSNHIHDNPNNFITSIQLMYARERTDDWIYDNLNLNKQQQLAYFKLRRMEDMIIDAIDKGMEKFDFVQMHKAGRLCKNDYEIFEELKDLNAEDWNI